MGLAIIAVVVLLYLVLAYLAAKQRQVWHVVIMVFLFLGCLGVCFLAAATLKTQEKWRQRYETADKSLITEKANQEQLLYGSVSSGELGETQLRGELSRLLVDRGRVWRNIRLHSIGENKIVLDPSSWSDTGCGTVASGGEEEGAAPADAAPAEETSPAEGAPADAAAPQAAPAAAPAVNPAGIAGLDPNAVVFAFKDASLGSLPPAIRKILAEQPKPLTDPAQGADEEIASNEDATEEPAVDTENVPEKEAATEADDTAAAASDTAASDTAENEEGASEPAAEEATDSAGESIVNAGCPIPIYFMGEFKVAENADAPAVSLTLVPNVQLSPAQIQQLEDKTSTWTLYEVMPVDDHLTFHGLKPAQLRQLIRPEGIPEAVYNRIIDEFTRDQGLATEQDAPERKWMVVKFKQEETVEVDVAAVPEGQQAASESAFDPSGRTIDPSLLQGGPVTFAEGDTAILDSVTAQELIAGGKAEAVRPIYERRLRDYARSFRSMAAELSEVARQIDLAQVDLDKLTQSLTDQQKLIASQTEYMNKLAADRDGMRRELAVLSEYQDKVEERVKEIRTELNRLYRLNRDTVAAP